MENKKKKSKAIVISIIALLVLVVALFLIYKNKDSFGVKTSSIITKIFSPLETSDNQKKELVQAGEDIFNGDDVSQSGMDGDTRIVRKSLPGEGVFGRALSDIKQGNTGEILLLESGVDSSSFWGSISGFLDRTFDFDFGPGKYKPACQDGKDNDKDGLVDIEDPNCHKGGDLNNEYVPKHFSESENPFDFDFVCSDGLDNDGDGTIDIEDPNCHKGGDLNNEYVPKHFSESENPFDFDFVCSDGLDNDGDGTIDIEDPNCHKGGDLNNEYVPKHFSESENPFDFDFGIDGIDLTPGVITPISSPINTEVTLRSTITNRGREETGQSFITLFTISETREVVSEKSIHLTTTVSPIPAESDTVATVKHTFTTIGTYYIRACADKNSIADEGLINEAYEDNNCSSWTTFNTTNVLPSTGNRPACSDEKDNDGDGLIDINDPSCHKNGDLNLEYLPEYTSESRTASECNDTLDNDNDGLIDIKDPICHFNSDINEIYLPEYNSESQPSYICNDTLDNDKDGKIDILDPNCHIDGILSNEYKPTHTSESESPEGPNICLGIEQNPITFTEEEQKKLDDLLRKFYLVTPNLKSDLDVSLVYDEINNQQNFINQISALTKECYKETSGSTYTGPTTRYGNPWYQYNTRGSYVKEFTQSTTSYCTRDNTKPTLRDFDGKICSTLKTRDKCEGLIPSFNFFSGFGYYKKTNCKWVETMNLEEYETLLNIW
jgi:hypothetical protein